MMSWVWKVEMDEGLRNGHPGAVGLHAVDGKWGKLKRWKNE
jgi:hypothetical protein